jgi:hypothetical protein
VDGILDAGCLASVNHLCATPKDHHTTNNTFATKIVMDEES